MEKTNFDKENEKSTVKTSMKIFLQFQKKFAFFHNISDNVNFLKNTVKKVAKLVRKF